MRCPFVSIVIPCYNAERYVGEAMQSALDQTYPHKEVIVIDDGSTDGSLDVIRSFGDAVRWESGPNRGGCAARNRGIKLARGVLIQFLDADDLLHPRKLDIQVDTALRVQPQIVVCDGEINLGNGEIRVYSLASDIDDPVELALRKWISTPSPLHWRETLIRIGGFREELPCSQERDLHLRLACAGHRFFHLAEVLYTQRKQRGSVSDNWEQVLDQRAKVAWHAYDLLSKTDQINDARARAFADFFAKDARSYLHLRVLDKCRRNFRWAAQLHQEGGLTCVYRSRTARVAHRLLGPINTNRLARIKQATVERFAHVRALFS